MGMSRNPWIDPYVEDGADPVRVAVLSALATLLGHAQSVDGRLTQARSEVAEMEVDLADTNAAADVIRRWLDDKS